MDSDNMFSIFIVPEKDIERTLNFACLPVKSLLSHLLNNLILILV